MIGNRLHGCAESTPAFPGQEVTLLEKIEGRPGRRGRVQVGPVLRAAGGAGVVDTSQQAAQYRHLAVVELFSWSRSRATVGNAERTNAGLKDLGSSRGGVPTVFSDQNGLINAEGTAPLDVSELKILGTYRVPAWGGFNVSGVYRYHSGGTWARTFLTPDFFPVRAEPRGSRRLPPIASLDLRVEKTLDGFGGRLGLFVDAFNVTNEGTATHVNSQSGSGFGEPIAWTDPRTIRAGLRYTF